MAYKMYIKVKNYDKAYVQKDFKLTVIQISHKTKH